MSREIPAALRINTYCHCAKCLQQLPRGQSPHDYSNYEVGFTEIGLQVWCKRHNCNIVHIDFEGQQHPANTRVK